MKTNRYLKLIELLLIILIYIFVPKSHDVFIYVTLGTTLLFIAFFYQSNQGLEHHLPQRDERITTWFNIKEMKSENGWLFYLKLLVLFIVGAVYIHKLIPSKLLTSLVTLILTVLIGYIMLSIKKTIARSEFLNHLYEMTYHLFIRLIVYFWLLMYIVNTRPNWFDYSFSMSIIIHLALVAGISYAYYEFHFNEEPLES